MLRQVGTIKLLSAHEIRRWFISAQWFLVLAAIMSLLGFISGSEFPRTASWIFLGLTAITAITGWAMEAKNNHETFVLLERRGFKNIRFKGDQDKFTATYNGQRIVGRLEHEADGTARILVHFND